MTTTTPAPRPTLSDAAARLPLIRTPESMPGVYLDTFTIHATDLRANRNYAMLWWALGVSAQHAGAWARHAFTPIEAWPWLDMGFSPEASSVLRGMGMTAGKFGPIRS